MRLVLAFDGFLWNVLMKMWIAVVWLHCTRFSFVSLRVSLWLFVSRSYRILNYFHFCSFLRVSFCMPSTMVHRCLTIITVIIPFPQQIARTDKQERIHFEAETWNESNGASRRRRRRFEIAFFETCNFYLHTNEMRRDSDSNVSVKEWVRVPVNVLLKPTFVVVVVVACK